MTSSPWTPDQLGSQDGRTFVITGANSGIGLEAAKRLGAAGATVVLAVRDTAKGERAAAQVPGTAEVRRLDLADLASVRAFADGWGDRPIDVLVNNAGVMALPLTRTPDGFEAQIGTNHLGHFALTGLLLEHVTDRVVTIASGAHRMGEIDLDDLNWERRPYRPWRAYGQSKLANLLFTGELERRLRAAGAPVKALAAHPGWAATHLQGRSGRRIEDAAMRLGNRLLAQDADRGAWPTLAAATSDLPGDTYIGPNQLFESRGHIEPVGRSKAAQDADVARRLWERSAALTGVRYLDGAARPVAA